MRRKTAGLKQEPGLSSHSASLSSFRMLFMLLTGLLTSLSSISVRALWDLTLGLQPMESPFKQLHYVWVPGLLFWFRRYWNFHKNNESTTDLGIVNSHLSKCCLGHDISDWFSHWTGPMDFAPRPISHWIRFHFNPNLLYQRAEQRLNPLKVF